MWLVVCASSLIRVFLLVKHELLPFSTFANELLVLAVEVANLFVLTLNKPAALCRGRPPQSRNLSLYAVQLCVCVCVCVCVSPCAAAVMIPPNDVTVSCQQRPLPSPPVVQPRPWDHSLPSTPRSPFTPSTPLSPFTSSGVGSRGLAAEWSARPAPSVRLGCAGGAPLGPLLLLSGRSLGRACPLLPGTAACSALSARGVRGRMWGGP